jgi:hypothetical protein
MKRLSIFIAAGACAMALAPAEARNTRLMLPIAAAMQAPETGQRLDGTVRFYFGSQPHPKVLARLGTDVSNRKTNSVGKSDIRGCNWAFLSALLSLEHRAKQLGANAVVNIVSFYNRVPVSSTTEFECHAGNIVIGVALKGDFVRLPGP